MNDQYKKVKTLLSVTCIHLELKFQPYSCNSARLHAYGRLTVLTSVLFKHVTEKVSKQFLIEVYKIFLL